MATQPPALKVPVAVAKFRVFPPAVVCYRKGTVSDAEAARIRKSLVSATKTATGKMLMTLWSLKGFEEPPKEYQASLDAILKAYPLPDERAERTDGKAGVKAATKVFAPADRK